LNSGEGADENLNHPVIETAICKIIYSGRPSLADDFPETFKHSVPIQSVALIGVIVFNCLLEMETGETKTIQLNADVYEEEYDKILHSICEVLWSPNGNVYKEQLRAWAKPESHKPVSGSSRLKIKLNLSAPDL